MLYTDYLDNFVQRNTLNPDQIHSGNIGDAIAPGTIRMSDTNFNYFQDFIGPDGLIGVDFITDKLDAEAGYIKGEFTFTDSGAISISEDANNGLWISPNGILGKKNGNNTFTLTNEGDATFGGTLAAATGIIQNVVANNITITGGSISWADVTAPSYGDIGGTKPPADADNTVDSIGDTYLTNITPTGIYTGTITGNLIQTSPYSNTGIKMSSNIGGMNVFGQSIYFRNNNGVYIGAIGQAYTGLTITSSRDIILESGNIKIHGTLSPMQNGSYNLGNYSYRFGNVFTYNVDFSSGKYINYTNSHIQLNSQSKIVGSLRITGNMVFENFHSITTKTSGGATIYLYPQWNATLGKYILCS